MNNFEVKTIPFKESDVYNLVKTDQQVDNWPVVYLLNNQNEIYIGETANILNRVSDHTKDASKTTLTNINIVFHPEFNKSVALHFESKLISHFSGLAKYKILNRNFGQSLSHNYFNKSNYDLLYHELWNIFISNGFVDKSINQIENLATFKYSPFKSLDTQQINVVNLVLECVQNKHKVNTILVNGGAGTGKSIIGIYLAKLLADVKQITTDNFNFFENDFSEKNTQLIKSLKGLALTKLKLGFVVPMENFRNTVTNVFKMLGNGLENLVLGPNDIFNTNEKFDVLIVDEAHRLKRDKDLGPEIGNFREINRKYFQGEDKNQLDWVFSRSNFQVLFYDKEQSIRSSDIPNEYFDKLSKNSNTFNIALTNQFRVLAGEKFIAYVDEIFSNNPPTDKINFNNYEIKIFDDIKLFREKILKKNSEVGLSRIVAGFSWPWITKKSKNKNNNAKFDFEIQNEQFTWNSTTGKSGWIESNNSVNEVGSIHTTQGFDLNYVGLIIGKDIYFNQNSQRIEINRSYFFDRGSSKGLKNDDEKLRKFILNSYKTMMKRGIKGLYLFILDEELKKKFNLFF